MKKWLSAAAIFLITVLGFLLKISGLKRKAAEEEANVQKKTAKVANAVGKAIIETEKEQNDEIKKVKKRTHKQSIDSIKSGGKL